VEVPRELTGHELSGFVFVGPSVQLWIDGDRPRKRPSLSFPAPRLPRGVAASRVKLMKGGPAIADGIDRHGRKVSERVRAHTAHSPRRVDRRLGPVFLIHYSPGTLYQPMAECSAEAEELTRLLKAPGKPCLRACASFLSLGRSPSAPALEKDSRYRVCAAMCKKGCLKRSCLLRAKAQADLAVCM